MKIIFEALPKELQQCKTQNLAEMFYDFKTAANITAERKSRLGSEELLKDKALGEWLHVLNG